MNSTALSSVPLADKQPESVALLATRNLGKLRELRPMFGASHIAVIDLTEAGVPETAEESLIEEFSTFEENALAKARYFRSRAGGIPTFADDSGLVVHALHGEPGVHSKRWCGRNDLNGHALDAANNELLVKRLAGIQDRTAHYVCAAAYADGERELVCCGIVHGSILDAPRGTLGFGYDPYFFSDELGRTFGEASSAEKERVSHRGRAFDALLRQLSMK